jgi:hypothetical protein
MAPSSRASVSLSSMTDSGSLLSREKAIDLAAPGLVNDDADRFALFGLERELHADAGKLDLTDFHR